ncbi:MAG: hypothetical protein QOI55_1899, partial [Actinomycetota bacterium]|nr:hypothetical protein [Actinomycetota bacterium]
MAGIAEIWVWTIEVPAETAIPDLKGYEVSARDGTIGKVEEVVERDDRRTYI